MIIKRTVSYTFGKRKVYGAYFMEEPMFLYLKARDTEYEIFPWYCKWGKKKEKRRQEFLMRRLPVELQECSVLGRKGLKVQLPFTYAQLKACDRDFLNGLLGRLKGKYGGAAVTGEANLLPVFPKEEFCDGSHIPLLFIEGIVEGILKLKGLKKKNVRLVLLDDGSVYSPFLLGLLGKHYNYLTLVTERLNRECEEEMERLFDECGLVVSLREGKAEGEIPGDIFIDTTGVAKKYCQNLPRGCVLLDLLGKNDQRYMESRIKDGMLCQSFLFGKEEEDGRGQRCLPQLLEAVCFGADGRNPFFFRKNLPECYDRMAGEGLLVLAINGEKIAGMS